MVWVIGSDMFPEKVSQERINSHQDFLEERDCLTLTHSLRKEGAQGGAREGRR